MICPLSLIVSERTCNTSLSKGPSTESKARIYPDSAWLPATPESQGIDAEIMNQALSDIEQHCGPDGIAQMLIIRQGYMIWQGNKIDSMHNVWSCTKSFTSTVLGLLIAEGKCQLDSKVGNFIPQLKERYPKVTFRHFTTMTSGYTAKGDKEASGHGQTKTPFIPDPPMFAAGTKYQYWDAAMNELAYALSKVAQQAIEEVFREKIASPIGLDPKLWRWGNWGEQEGIIINGGAGNKGKGMMISASEMAKFGYLFLKNGKWKEKQILSEEWINQATSIQVIEPIAANDDGHTPGLGNYGFNWWLGNRWPHAPSGTYAAVGHNNNMCFVIPKWDMVVVRLGMDGDIDDEYWDRFFNKLSKAIKGN